MPDPLETLRLLVEAAVAIAGFSGVVVVFGRRVEGAWSPIERDRLENLLVTSLTVLFLAFVALVLLHAGNEPSLTWRVGSAIWCLIATFEIGVTVRRAMRSQRRNDPEVPHVAWIVSLLGFTVLMVVLNVANALGMQEFWPFLAGLVWLFALSAYSFVRLLFVVARGRPGG